MLLVSFSSFEKMANQREVRQLVGQLLWFDDISIKNAVESSLSDWQRRTQLNQLNSLLHHKSSANRICFTQKNVVHRPNRY